VKRTFRKEPLIDSVELLNFHAEPLNFQAEPPNKCNKDHESLRTKAHRGARNAI